MFKGAAYLPTSPGPSRTSNSLRLKVEVFLMKSLGRILCNSLFLNGAAILPSLTSATARLWVSQDVALESTWLDMPNCRQQELTQTNGWRQMSFLKKRSISSVFVEQLNVFAGQIHINTDDWAIRYWDGGRKSVPQFGFEGHDEGDMSANAATSSFSSFAENTWMTVEEVAQLLNTTVDDFSLEKFNQVYNDTWIKEHEKQAASQNPNTEVEQEIIDAAPGTAEDGGTDPIDDSASGRKLVSVAGRFVSAALRVLGI